MEDALQYRVRIWQAGHGYRRRSAQVLRLLQAGARLSPNMAEAPTRVRYWVIVFAVALAVVTYIDRVCIANAAPYIRADLGLARAEMGYISEAFTAYVE